MRKPVLFLIAIALLYVVPSLILEAVYGPSYGFLSGEDCWIPDGQGGWVEHGSPADPPPTQPSVGVPIMVRYIPIFLPTLLLILFMFTPLSRKLESRPAAANAPPDDSAVEENSDPDRLS